MQETKTFVPPKSDSGDNLSVQSLATLLALVGTKSMDVDALRGRTRLSPTAFGKLMGWLQHEYLVDIVSSLNGDRVTNSVQLTEKGESVLVSILERTCELPELR